jgi:hypothetical protein
MTAPAPAPTAPLATMPAERAMPIDIIEHEAGLVDGPGFYDMPAAVYHADPAPEPSLSSGVARTILACSPKHGWQKHPRLNPPADSDDDEASNKKMHVGSVVHELLLGKGGGYKIIKAKDFRTKAAQEQRDLAMVDGFSPILEKDMDRAWRIANRLRERLPQVAECDGAFKVGGGETVAIWRDPIGIWGRAMLDWWGADPAEIWDLKTTTGGLSDRDLRRRILDDRIHVQVEWYKRGVAQLWPDLAGRIRYRLIFAEQDEPHELRVIELPPAFQALGERQAVTAAVQFQHGLETGEWPGYPNHITEIECPDWALTEWEERETTDANLSLPGVGEKLLLARSSFAPITSYRRLEYAP